METKNKFPFWYYFALLLALIVTILFWYLLFDRISIEPYPQSQASNSETPGYFDNPEFGNYQDQLPDEIGEINEIDTSKIEIDSLTGRTIVSNLINVAVKNQAVPLKTFLLDLLKKVDTADYKVVYADSTINRVQLEVNSDSIPNFKVKLRKKLNNYDLLVWDEVLFSSSYNESKLNDPTFSWYFNAINAQQAWSISTGDKDIVVAVIDNGFDINHPELKGKSIKPYNVTSRNNNVSPASQNHGTHVAATIVAKSDNNLGLVGIAPKCTFMPIKVSDQNGNMTNSYIIDGILYAIKNKASVINISLGMAISPNFGLNESQQQNYINTQGKDEEDFWNELFKFADDRKVTCVIAAGNSHIMAGYDPFQRSKYTIKVGAVDKNLKKADFSNYGKFVTVYAPGVSIYSAKPNGGFEFLDGTSMASPIVAGSVALLKSKNRNISNEDIIKLLTKSARVTNGLKVLDLNRLVRES
jgi:subtilisin family serine protease